MKFEPNTPAGLFQPVSPDQANTLLDVWNWRLGSGWSILGRTAFGDIFFQDQAGAIHMLDLVMGGVKQVAYCIEEFEFDLCQEERQDDLLIAKLTLSILSTGVKICPPSECLAFRTPPWLNGAINPSNVVVWDLMKYHQGLSNLMRQTEGLLLGTRIVPKG